MTDTVPMTDHKFDAVIAEYRPRAIRRLLELVTREYGPDISEVLDAVRELERLTRPRIVSEWALDGRVLRYRVALLAGGTVVHGEGAIPAGLHESHNPADLAKAKDNIERGCKRQLVNRLLEAAEDLS